MPIRDAFPLVPVVLLPLVLAACSAPGMPLRSLAEGEIELVGPDSRLWSGGTPGAMRDLRFQYETVAWRGRAEAPFHRMRTELLLSYDPESSAVRAARMIATEAGHAFRHVCVAPDGPALHLRISTLLDGRPDDLTVLKIHERALDLNACAEVGVGPRDGLVEGIDILFKEDGSFVALPGPGAYLAGASLRVERTMTRSPDPADRATATFP